MKIRAKFGILVAIAVVSAGCGRGERAADSVNINVRTEEIRTEETDGSAINVGRTKTEAIEFASGAEIVRGELFLPAGEGLHSALIVIHEWWGLNDQVRSEARKLAEAGYVSLAVDLYRGRLATNTEEAHELSRGLPEDRAERDLRGAFEFLAARADVDSTSIGSIGWCMGGGYSLKLAVVEPRLAACVLYYGRLLTDDLALAKIEAPVAGFFGEDDRGIPLDSVRAFEATMKRLGKNVQIHTYAGAGHAFANADKPGYREDAARDAWGKTMKFLREHLK